MGGVDAYGNTEQKFHLLGTVETTNNTTQYLELTGLDTSYAMIEFVFTGWIDHSGGGGTNIGSGQFTNGPTIQMQGAWPGGTHSSAAHYRAINVYQNGATSGVYHRIGDSINTSSVMLSPNWGRIGKLFYQSGSNAEENRFTVNFVCVGPGDNTQKTIKWDGGGNAETDSGGRGGAGRPGRRGILHPCARLCRTGAEPAADARRRLAGVARGAGAA